MNSKAARRVEPMAQLRLHLEQAVREGDPCAPFAVLSTVDAEGAPAMRMVTLREVTAHAVSLTINAQSPKAQHLRANGQWELLCFLPGQMIQCRLRGTARFDSDDALEQAWSNKPRASRLADTYHATVRPQSSVLPDRQTLIDEIASLGRRDIDHCKPGSVVTLLLVPTFVELWVGSPADRLHDRQIYKWGEGAWRVQTVVP